MNLNEFHEKIKEIKKRGFIESYRKGNTGVGHTLEQILGLTENNISDPDLEEIELKSQRKNATNRVTMFTFNRGAWQKKQNYIVEKYGYTDSNGRPALYSTVNNIPNPQGLFLSIKLESKLMLLNHSDEIVLAQWSIEHLVNQFEKKMPNLIIVLAENKFENGKEYFWYNEAYLLEKGNKKMFIEFINKGIIVVDIRIHLKPNGTIRNHGTAFRIEEKKLSDCFFSKKTLICND